MKTKTIEERAKEVSILYQYKSNHPYDKLSVEHGYIQGATEQKAIDDEELLKLKSAWEKETYINPYDEVIYKQGYHDAIEKACEWLKGNIEGGVHPQSAYGFVEKFRKAMEK